MRSETTDVIILGAGVAGLAAAADLGRGGLRVVVVEARDRIGGRVFTTQTDNGVSVELGAEFVHGRPPQVFDHLGEIKSELREVEGSSWMYADGRLQRCDKFFEMTDSIMQRMDDKGPDRSFADFLVECCPDKEHAKPWAQEFVEGFHASPSELVSLHSLVRDNRAEEESGDQDFQFTSGYQALVDAMAARLDSTQVLVSLNTVATAVEWGGQNVRVIATRNGERIEFSAPRALITLPLGVLQADAEGAVRFDPPLAAKEHALGLLHMGPVIRMSLVFSQRWWEQVAVPDEQAGVLGDMSFVFSHHEWFPTWWRSATHAAVLTGWASARRAVRLHGKSDVFVMDKALEALTAIFGIGRQALKAMLLSWHTHDWQSDPFARGAYSFVGVGGENAMSELAAPLEGTLFFAGEATNTSGHHGTVHGAIATGQRAAREILSAAKASGYS